MHLSHKTEALVTEMLLRSSFITPPISTAVWSLLNQVLINNTHTLYTPAPHPSLCQLPRSISISTGVSRLEGLGLRVASLCQVPR